MRNCNWCGSRVKKDARKCDNCGKELRIKTEEKSIGAKPANVAQKPVQASRIRVRTGSVPDRQKPRGFPGLFLVLFIFAAGGVFVWLKKGPRTEEPVPANGSSLSIPVEDALEDLKSSTASRRMAACQMMASHDPLPPEVAPHLIPLLEDPDEQTRGMCSYAIGKSGKAAQDAIPALLKNLRHSSAYVRLTSAESLGYIAAASDRSDVVPELAALLNDSHDQVRRFALVGLQQFGERGAAARPQVIKALKDSAFDVRTNAITVLVRLNDQSPELVQILTERLRDSEPSVRQLSAQFLADMGPAARAAIPKFVELLKDPDPYIRVAAVNGLGNCCKDSSETVSYLIQSLADSESEVHGAAILQLGTLGPNAGKAVPALIPFLSGELMYLRLWTAETLGKIGPAAHAAVPRLRQMVHEKIESVESEASQIPAMAEEALRKIENANLPAEAPIKTESVEEP